MLILGVAYKPDIGDMRESPALKLISLLQNAGATVSYHDPHVPRFAEHGLEMESVLLDPAAYDCVVIVTDHHSIDYDAWSTTRASSSTSATRPGGKGNHGDSAQGLQAVMTGSRRQAGLGYWGPNLARNFDDLGDLAGSDASRTGATRAFAERYPQARDDRRLRRAARRRRTSTRW